MIQQQWYTRKHWAVKKRQPKNTGTGQPRKDNPTTLVQKQQHWAVRKRQHRNTVTETTALGCQRKTTQQHWCRNNSTGLSGGKKQWHWAVRNRHPNSYWKDTSIGVSSAKFSVGAKEWQLRPKDIPARICPNYSAETGLLPLVSSSGCPWQRTPHCSRWPRFDPEYK